MGVLNSKSGRQRHKLSLLIATGLAVLPTLALAQEAPEAESHADDNAAIVVTAAARANERTEAAQRTVTSTSVINADQLEHLGIGSTLDLMNITPNLYQPRNTMSRSAAQYFIRGIGELDAQGEPSVGTFLDGVYVTRNLGAMQELLDIESIQVDRGPVIGVGHVVEGGAVRLFSLVPDNDLRVEAEAGYGSLNEWKAGFLVSGPLVKDRLYASFAIGHHQRDGTDYNITLNRKVNTIDVTQARAKLRFTPDDRLDFTLSIYGTLDYSTNRGYGNFLNANKYDLIAPVYPRNRFGQFGVTGNTSYRFNDNLNLTSVTAYRGFNDDANYENTGDRFARNSSPLTYEDQAWSQDLYLKGRAGRLDFTIGAYGQYEYWRTDRNVNVSRTLYGASGNTIIFTPVNAYIVQKNYNLSDYGEARYKVTDEIVLEAGLRLNWERHKTAETLSYLVPGGDHTITVTDVSQVPAELAALYTRPPQGGVAWRIAAAKSWTQLLPRIGISWEFSPNSRAYASITQGVKSGGFDFRANSPATPSQATTPYNPERVTTYEVGLIVTSADPGAAYNFGHQQPLLHADRYARAEEFVDVVCGLWDSWDEGAFILDRTEGRYLDLNAMHLLNHEGAHFRVKGPLNIPRSPQGRRLLIHAGASEPGKALAARVADIVFAAQPSTDAAVDFYRDSKARLSAHDRHGGEQLILPGLCPIIGRSRAEAEGKLERLQSFVDPIVGLDLLRNLAGGADLSAYPLDGPLPDLGTSETAKGRQSLVASVARSEGLTIRDLYLRVAIARGHRCVIGTATDIADAMEEMFVAYGADGFNIMSPTFPDGLTDFIDLVLPELRRRGLVGLPDGGTTLRGRLGLDMVGPVRTCCNRY